MKKQMSAKSIVIIGCGNLAWHLAKHFASLESYTISVYNHRKNKNLNEFRKLGCRTFRNLNSIEENADYYFLCISDENISVISSDLKTGKGLVVHCSGSQPVSVLHQEQSAVMYPLQTFSRKDKVQWKEIPLLIEGSTSSALKKIKALAKQFSPKVYEISSDERLKLHLAAVLVNNFPNALYAAADNYLKGSLKTKSRAFELLLPLIRQTTAKLEHLSPAEAQTGPAKRNDTRVMKAHEKLLSDNSQLKKIYKELSALILTQQKQTHA